MRLRMKSYSVTIQIKATDCGTVYYAVYEVLRAFVYVDEIL